MSIKHPSLPDKFSDAVSPADVSVDVRDRNDDEDNDEDDDDHTFSMIAESKDRFLMDQVGVSVYLLCPYEWFADNASVLPYRCVTKVDWH